MACVALLASSVLAQKKIWSVDGVIGEEPLNPTPTWDHAVGHTPPIGSIRPYLAYGTSVLLPINLNIANPVLDRVMRLGGGLGDFYASAPNPALAVDTVETCDTRATGSAADWQPFSPSMHEERMFLNSVLLPDGSILVVGGVDVWHPDLAQQSHVLDGEMLVNGVWEKTALMQSKRGYHSTAILLPSGRVLVGGGNTRSLDYEIYEPPYFYRGTRPQITSAPVQMTYAAADAPAILLLGASRTSFAGNPLPLPLVAIGLPCLLHTSVDVFLAVGPASWASPPATPRSICRCGRFSPATTCSRSGCASIPHPGSRPRCPMLCTGGSGRRPAPSTALITARSARSRVRDDPTCRSSGCRRNARCGRRSTRRPSVSHSCSRARSPRDSGRRPRLAGRDAGSGVD